MKSFLSSPSLIFLRISKLKASFFNWKPALILFLMQGPTTSWITFAIPKNFPLIFILRKTFLPFYILSLDMLLLLKNKMIHPLTPSVSFYYTLSLPGCLYQSCTPWLWTYFVAVYLKIPPFGPPSSPTWRIFQPYFRTTINTFFLSSRPLFF